MGLDSVQRAAAQARSLPPTGAGEAKTVPLGDIDFNQIDLRPGSPAPRGVRRESRRRQSRSSSWTGKAGTCGSSGPTSIASSAEVFAGRQESRHPELEVRCADLEPGRRCAHGPARHRRSHRAGDSVERRWATPLSPHRSGALPVELQRYEIATGRKTAWQKLEPVDLAGVSGLQRASWSPATAGTTPTAIGPKTKSDLYVIDGLQGKLW